MLYGLLDLPWWGYIVAALAMTHITIAGVTIFLHRHQAHRALDLHPAVSHFFRLWLWLSTGMETKIWVAVHRKHHVFSDVEGDPHSPQVEGIKKVLWQGAELYRTEGKNQETLDRYGKGTPDDWLEKNIYAKYSAKGVVLMLLIDLLLFGLPGITIWAVQMMWIPFFAAGVVNGVAHYWGYRNFEVADTSKIIFPWGILIGGEELHNNHHTYPLSAKLSVKWWEFDIGWLYIRTLSLLGLAKVNHLPPKLTMESGKSLIDAETVKAIFSNRFVVMARYAKEVIKPVFNEEKRKASSGHKLLRKEKALLIRDEVLIADAEKQQLNEMLANNDKLQIVYQFRVKFQAIWGKTASNQKELLEALQEWCKQAEATGLDALRDFAESLRKYTLQMPAV